MSVAAVILAAGRSTRMGQNKMLAEIGGEALIRKTARSVLMSRCRPAILVVGNEPEKVRDAVLGLDLAIVTNPNFAEGLSTSLAAGIAAVPPDASGALICLGDMPLIGSGIADALIGCLERTPAAGAVVPAHGGEWGNPVLIARKLFPEIAKLEGDAGARKILRGRDDVLVLDTEDASVLIDADTPQDLAKLQQELDRRSDR
jgi:molybdenum cofactor cytidylyltransferase